MITFKNINERTIECTIKEGNRTYIGNATCHPEDQYEEVIGKNVAFSRAALAQARSLRDETLIEYRTIKQLFDAIRINPRFEEDSMELRIIMKRMKSLEDEIKDWKFCIKTLNQQISEEIHSRAIYDRLKAGLNKPKD